MNVIDLFTKVLTEDYKPMVEGDIFCLDTGWQNIKDAQERLDEILIGLKK